MTSKQREQVTQALMENYLFNDDEVQFVLAMHPILEELYESFPLAHPDTEL